MFKKQQVPGKLKSTGFPAIFIRQLQVPGLSGNAQRPPKGGFTISTKTKLKFCFHNPNTPEAAACRIAELLIKVNQEKLKRILQAEAEKRIETDNTFIQEKII